MKDAAVLLPVVAILAAGLASILAAKALRVSAVVGFLIVGVLLGEHGFKVVSETPATHLLAELGVVFLLFDIGLHFSLREVRRNPADMLALAPAQMALCGAGFAIAARGLGLDWPVAVLVGLTFALSSTAVVARLMVERGLTNCPLGRSTTSVLIFQDLAAIFLLVFAQSLADAQSNLAAASGLAALKALLAFAAAMTIGRFVATPLFRALAATRNEDAFPAAALLTVMGSAAATGSLGLSMSLGAFLAGMIIGETPYKHVIQTEARPFRSLLLGFFFISVGMSVEVPALLPQLWLVCLLALAFMGAKTALIVLAAKASRWSTPGAVQLGALLGQGSEFALVILALPAVGASLPGGVGDLLVAAAALTLALTPGWSWLGLRLARRLAQRIERGRAEPASAAAPEVRASVVVFRMTPMGRLAVDALSAHGIKFRAVDDDPDRFAAAIADGYDVVFGDLGDLRFADVIEATDADAFVLGETRYEVSKAITPIAAERFPNLVRFVAVADEHDLERHQDLGMRAFLMETDPPGVDLVRALLAHVGVAAGDIETWIETRRRAIAIEAEAAAVIRPAA